MRKIPTLYARHPADRHRMIVGDVTPGCEWVLRGEGVATRKFDGMCTMLDEQGQWWVRHELLRGARSPEEFVEVDYDATTGSTFGWVPAEASSFATVLHEAIDNLTSGAGNPGPGTYELVGPQVGTNPEGEPVHTLVPHGTVILEGGPAELMEQCAARGWEGVVWHHPDGRAAKLKVRDLPSSDG